MTLTVWGSNKKYLRLLNVIGLAFGGNFMQFKLRVQKVLVTGGGSGIGLAIAKALIQEGCSVCICGRNLQKLEQACKDIGS